jgi:hypothetical protein
VLIGLSLVLMGTIWTMKSSLQGLQAVCVESGWDYRYLTMKNVGAGGAWDWHLTNYLEDLQAVCAESAGD